jgi:hypothetical protein
MTMKEFLEEINNNRHLLSETAVGFLDELIEKNHPDQLLTDTGKKILITMQENMGSFLNIFSSKQLGELLFMPARSVSGSIRKLVNEGYVIKNGLNPVTYGLTEQGKALKVDKD